MNIVKVSNFSLFVDFWWKIVIPLERTGKITSACCTQYQKIVHNDVHSFFRKSENCENQRLFWSTVMGRRINATRWFRLRILPKFKWNIFLKIMCISIMYCPQLKFSRRQRWTKNWLSHFGDPLESHMHYYFCRKIYFM